jgi:hypothetical protein
MMSMLGAGKRVSSSNAKLKTELIQGIHTKFALKGGQIGLV